MHRQGPWRPSRRMRAWSTATIEMAQEAGEENLFLFGLTAQQVADSRGWYNPHWHYENELETRAALDLIFLSTSVDPSRGYSSLCATRF